MRKLSILTFLLTSILSFAQHYTPYYYGTKEGLNSESIYRTISVPSGQLYLATQRGLTMYDGYRFISNPKINTNTSSVTESGNDLIFYDATGLNSIKDIHSDPKMILGKFNTDSDPNNDHFENLFVDSHGRIWGTDFENVKYYDSNTKQVKSFLIDSGNKNLSLNIRILESIENEIWIAAKTGLWVWKEKENKLSLYPDEQINKLQFQFAKKLKNNQLMLSTLQGRLIQINLKTKAITELNPLPDNQMAIGFAETPHGILIAGTHKIYLSTTNGYKEIFRTENQFIHHLNYEEKTGIIWLSTSKGLIKLLPENPAVETDFFTNSTIISITQDAQNRIWAATSNGEVWCKNSNIWKKIQQFEKEEIFNINESKNEIFLSTSNGIYVLNGTDFRKLNLSEHLTGSEIVKTFITPQNELWVVFSMHQMEVYSWPDLNKIKEKFANPESFWTDNKWQDVAVDAQQRIWLAGWMPKSFGITYYNPFNREFVDVSNKKINPDKGQFVGDYFTKIGLGNNQTLLFTAFGGWNRTDENGKIIQKVDVHQYEIADTHFRGITEDANGNVFFATGEGLHIYRKNLDKVVRLTQIDGLPTNYLLHSFYTLNNGNIAMGTEKGVIFISVQKALKNVLRNELAFSQILVNGQIKFIKNNFLELNQDERDLSIQFSDLSFQSPEKVNFKYRFSDEENWHSLGNKPELLLYHLQPGEYKITFRAEDNLGNIQSKELVLNILLHPPFTKSNLFYGLILFVILLIVFLVNRYLWNKQKKEQAYQRKIKEAEMQTLRSQMNPHFLFNTLNSINSFIIQNKTEDASSYLTTFSKLMRSILENSKQEFISFQKELQTLKLYLELESARLEHSFDYQYDIDKNVDVNEIQIPPLIIQPFAENAIWHGLRNKKGKGLLIVGVQQPDEETVHIIIKDNGIGREASRNLKKEQTQHKSYGIEITKERLLMLDAGNTVEIEDLYSPEGNPTGTQVRITIKLKDYD